MINRVSTTAIGGRGGKRQPLDTESAIVDGFKVGLVPVCQNCGKLPQHSSLGYCQPCQSYFATTGKGKRHKDTEKIPVQQCDCNTGVDVAHWVYVGVLTPDAHQKSVPVGMCHECYLDHLEQEEWLAGDRYAN